MNKVTNLIIYTVILGGLSIGLVYFIPPFWRDIAVYSMLGLGVLVSVQNYVSDDSIFYAQLSPTRGPEESSSTIPNNANSAYYYTLGLLLFGIGYLLLL